MTEMEKIINTNQECDYYTHKKKFDMEMIIADMQEIAKTNKFSHRASRILCVPEFIDEHEDVEEWYVINEPRFDMIMITPVKSPIAGILRFSTATLLSYADQCTAGYIYYYDPDAKDEPATSINIEYVMRLDIEDVREFTKRIPKLLMGIGLVLGQINDIDTLSDWTLLDDPYYCMDVNVCDSDNGVKLSIAINDTSCLSSMEIDIVLSFIKFCTELSIGVSDAANEIFRQLILLDNEEPSIELIYKYMTFYGFVVQ